MRRSLNRRNKVSYSAVQPAITGMTIRPIVRYPDARLALPAQPVTAFDDALRELANDLLNTMHAAPGIGITAPHIGVSLRVVVLHLDATEDRADLSSIRRSSGHRPR